MIPSGVHSVNSTSATRVGCTHDVSLRHFGPGLNGESSRGSSTRASSSSVAPVKPVPTRPA